MSHAVFGVVAILTCGVPGSCQAPLDPHGRLDEVWFHVSSLENNLLGDNPDKRIFIYLPPSYDLLQTERYPVIYFLHGFALKTGIQDVTAKALKNSMDRLIADNQIQEMIVVIPDGKNSLGGAFYANSTTSGRYEDYIVQDLVTMVDRNYRTVASPSGRGISGHSMGGFGAISIGFNHPDVFGAVYAMSPCCLDFGTDSSLLQSAWREALNVKTGEDAKKMMDDGHFFGSVYIAMAAAWSPNARRAPLFSEFPFREEGGKLVPNEPAYSEWRTHSVATLVKAKNNELLKLRGIAMDYGSREADVYIPRGARELSQALADLGVPHRLEIFDGDHTSEEERRMGTIMLPFFSGLLTPSDRTRRAPGAL